MPSTLWILAGDIGGTNSRFGLLEARENGLGLRWNRTWPSRDASSLVELVRHARDEVGRSIDAASFGVAGPIVDGCVRATNLPWIIDSRELAAELGLARVGLINDLEAHAWSIDGLAPGEFALIQPGASDARGNRALIAPGTGLGEAGLYFDGAEHHAFACEGGHSSFAPTSELEIDLWRHLAERFEHVSFERVLSGPGLSNVYEFLRDTGRFDEPTWLARDRATGDPSAAISKAALAGTSELASAALDLFVRVLGSEAGNLALKTMATGGVFVGGGIAPKIASRVTSSIFREAFVAKGRMRALMESIPVRMIRYEHAALLGAARHARTHASEE